MAKYLIINADGYGFTPGVNDGIVETFKSGFVTSTSCTPNFGFLGDAGRVQKQFPDVSFGIHFNLSVGAPLSPVSAVRSLVGEDGKFLGSGLLNRIVRREVRVEEAERELSAQAAILADQNVKISHWDGHQNKHLWPLYFGAGVSVAKRFNIGGIRSHRRLLFTNSGALQLSEKISYYLKNPKRVLTHLGGRLRTASAERSGFVAADNLITPGYADDSHKSLRSFWEVLATTLPEGISEIYCHPGFPDDILRNNAKYVDQRADETRILTDPSLLELYRTNKIELINFFDLASLRRR